ncbi:hypothetical protein ACQEVF_57610 [Nonomuraea polychroma]|uniref:hypothetical protein n=1 Tax=Nonomuraea polychroma TaxID=46176 RepID=UPI003D90C8F1
MGVTRIPVQRLIVRLAVIVGTVIALIPPMTTPALAAGGEVDNTWTSSRAVLISNCWDGDDDDPYIKESYFLDCHYRENDPHPVIGNVPRAAISLPVGGRSTDYSEYNDTDAVRFPAGCVTTAHFWGGSQYDTDRRGKLPLWGRVRGWQHFYIDKIVC